MHHKVMETDWCRAPQDVSQRWTPRTGGWADEGCVLGVRLALDSRKGLRKDRAEPDRGTLKGTRWQSLREAGTAGTAVERANKRDKGQETALYAMLTECLCVF